MLFPNGRLFLPLLLFGWGRISYGDFSLGLCWKCFRAENEILVLAQVFGGLQCVFVFVFLNSVTQALVKSFGSSYIEEVTLQAGRCMVQRAAERCLSPVR